MNEKVIKIAKTMIKMINIFDFSNNKDSFG